MDFDFAEVISLPITSAAHAKGINHQRGIQTKITTSLSSPLIEWMGEYLYRFWKKS